MLLCTTISKRFTIEMVHHGIIIMSSLPPSKGSLHSVLSPREIVMGNKFKYSKIQFRQYIQVQGLVGGTNNTEQERSIGALYLGLINNGSGLIVFKYLHYLGNVVVWFIFHDSGCHIFSLILVFFDQILHTYVFAFLNIFICSILLHFDANFMIRNWRLLQKLETILHLNLLFYYTTVLVR